MTFNPKESIDFNGNTGPFIQYTYARIKSVQRKAAEKILKLWMSQIPSLNPMKKRLNLIKILAGFPGVISGCRYSNDYCSGC